MIARLRHALRLRQARREVRTLRSMREDTYSNYVFVCGQMGVINRMVERAEKRLENLTGEKK